MTTVASGQTLSVTSGQTSTGVIVDSGGTLDVFAGGKVSSTVDSGFVQCQRRQEPSQHESS